MEVGFVLQRTLLRAALTVLRFNQRPGGSRPDDCFQGERSAGPGHNREKVSISYPAVSLPSAVPSLIQGTASDGVTCYVRTKTVLLKQRPQVTRLHQSRGLERCSVW